MSLHYLWKHEPGNCVFSVRHRHVFTHILLENVGGSEQNRSVIANVQSDDLWHAATHILQEKTRACGVLKVVRIFFSFYLTVNKDEQKQDTYTRHQTLVHIPSPSINRFLKPFQR